MNKHTLLLLILSSSNLFSQDFYLTKNCRNSDYKLSHSGQYVSYIAQQGSIDNLGSKGFNLQIYDLINKKITNDEHIAFSNFKWALGSDYFYISKEIIPRIEQGKIAPAGMGILSKELHNPFSVTINKNLEEGVNFSAETIVPDNIKSNLGFIPVINQSSRLPYSLSYRRGISFENRKILKKSFLEERKINTEGTLHWWVNTNGQPYARLSIAKPVDSYSVISVYPNSTKDKTEVLKGDIKGLFLEGGWPGNINFFPVYDSVFNNFTKVYSITNYQTNTISLYENDVQSLKPLKLIYTHPDYDIKRPILGWGGKLLGVEIYTTTNEFIPLSDAGRKLKKFINKLTHDIHQPFDINIATSTGDDDGVIVSFHSLSYNKVYHISLSNNSFTELPQQCEQTNNKTVVLKGTKSTAYLTYQKSTINKPLIIMLHGGPRLQDKLNVEDNAIFHYFSNQGYPILRLNYKGSSGFGTQFLDLTLALNKRQSLNEIDEFLAAAKQKLGGTERKIVIYGHSYGGYLVLKAAHDQKLLNEIDGFVAISAPLSPSDLNKSFGDLDFGYFSKIKEKALLPLPVVKLSENTLHQKQGLLIWGEHDKIVKPELNDYLAMTRKLKWFKPITLTNSSHSVTPDLELLITKLDQFFSQF